MPANTARCCPAVDVAVVRWCDARPMACHSTTSPTPLAIFSVLKGLPKKTYWHNLKKSRGHFKQALREIKDK